MIERREVIPPGQVLRDIYEPFFIPTCGRASRWSSLPYQRFVEVGAGKTRRWEMTFYSNKTMAGPNLCGRASRWSSLPYQRSWRLNRAKLADGKWRFVPIRQWQDHNLSGRASQWSSLPYRMFVEVESGKTCRWEVAFCSHKTMAGPIFAGEPPGGRLSPTGCSWRCLWVPGARGGRIFPECHKQEPGG